MRPPDVRPAVRAHAAALHAQALAAPAGPHHVASPLGAWVLLALLADLPGTAAADGFSQALGTTPQDALTAARRLLAQPPASVAVAAAAWGRETVADGPLERWVAALPDEVPRGPVPSQQALDAWAARSTDGLVDRFPLSPDPETFLVLATALATRVRWARPLRRVPASSLGERSHWPDLTHVLLAPGSGPGHVAGVVRRGPDLLGVHVAGADGLAVLSVVGDRDLPPHEVLGAALDLAPAALTGLPDAVPPWDLPGSGHAWTLREEVVAVGAPGLRTQAVESVLPAWRAASRHDLADHPSLGLVGLGRVLDALLPPHLRPVGVQAVQEAVAGYGAEGFEAGAVSAISLRAGSAAPGDHEGLRRTVTLRFDRPFACVAVSTDERWWGLPVFSAWVAETVDA